MDRPAVTRRAVLAGAGAFLGAGCLGAEATPAPRSGDWRMCGRDPGRTRHVPDLTPAADDLAIAWQQSTGAGDWLPPVVADGTAYCQYANGLFVLDVETGEGHLANTYGGFGRGATMALASTVPHRDGSLLAQYGDAVASYAAATGTWPAEVDGLGEGRMRWRTDGSTGQRTGISHFPAARAWAGSPLVVDERVVTLHPQASTVAVLDTSDGRARWRYDLERDANTEWGLSPITHVVDAATGTVVVKSSVGQSTLLVGLDLETGTREWHTELPVVVGHHAETWPSLLAEGGTVYTVDFADEKTVVAAHDAATGESAWRRERPDGDLAGLAADDERLYYVARSGPVDGRDRYEVVALSRTDGRPRWDGTVENGFLGMGVPTVAGDAVLVPAGPDSALYALDAETGETRWVLGDHLDLRAHPDNSQAPATPPVVSGDRLVFGTYVDLHGIGIG